MNYLPQDLKLLVGQFLSDKNFINFVKVSFSQPDKIGDYILERF